MSTWLLLNLLSIIIIASTTQLDETCTSSCQLTWTRNYQDTNSSSCSCGHSPMNGNPGCANLPDNQIRVTVDKKFCITFDKEDNMTYVGSCPYNSLLFLNQQYGDSVVHLPQNALELNDFVCNVSNFTRYASYILNVCGQQRRQGMLCSKCGEGLGPAVLSYTHPCIECKWYGWVIYLTLSFVPATILCFIIIMLRINVLSPPLNAIVIFCHIMVSHVNHIPCLFLDYATLDISPVFPLVLVALTIYGFFNMDFLVYVLPPLCVSHKMSTLTVIALDYLVALYPLLLSALIYLLIEKHDDGCLVLRWMWRPFHKCFVRFRRSWDVKGSTINAFATLYVLSFTKVVSTSVNLMLPVPIVNTCGDKIWSRLYYDASCGIFQPCHYPYAFLTLAVSITFIVLPSLYIFLHPCNRLFNRCICRGFQCRLFQLASEVAKIFQQSFKDGTENTKDCRWFAGIYLLIRIVVATSVNWRMTQQIQVISAFLGIMLVAIFQPHTHSHYNVLDSLFFTCLGVMFILLPAGQSHHSTQVYILFLPLLIIVGVICWKVLFIKKYINGHNILLHLCQVQKLFKNIVSRRANDNVIIQQQEQEPLVDNTLQSNVLYTVVDINH